VTALTVLVEYSNSHYGAFVNAAAVVESTTAAAAAAVDESVD